MSGRDREYRLIGRSPVKVDGSRDETLHDITLRDPDSELDDEGLHKYAGGFCYIGEVNHDAARIIPIPNGIPFKPIATRTAVQNT